MVGVDQGRVQLANYVGDTLRDIIAVDEQHIDLAVKASITHEMVIGRMLKGDS